MLTKFVIGLLHLYRWVISPLTPPSCRYTPTCSRYAIQSIEFHGLRHGLWLTFKRLSKCHPFTGQKTIYMADPVPAKKTANTPNKKTTQQTG